MINYLKTIFVSILIICGLCFSQTCVTIKKSSTSSIFSDSQVNYALNLAKTKKLSCVYLEKGIWRFTNPINIPEGIILKGSNTDIHNSTDDNVSYHSSIECRYGANTTDDNNSCIKIAKNGGIDGFTIVWPDQYTQTTNSAPGYTYPFGINCLETCSIKNTTLANAYKAIQLNGDNNNLKNINIGAYKNGIVINSPNNFGTIYNGNIHDQFMWGYYLWPVGSGPDGMTLNPVIDTLENHYLYYNLTGVEINNASAGTINGLFVYKSLEGFKINTNPTLAYTGSNNNTINFINSGCDLCNYSLTAYTQKPQDNINFINGQLFGKVSLGVSHTGKINITATQLAYHITALETGKNSHITVNGINSQLYISNGDITTAGLIGEIPFDAAVIWTNGLVNLHNVNIICPHLYAEGYKTSVPGMQTLINYLQEEYLSVTKDMRHLLTNGEHASITYVNGFLLGYDVMRPIQYINGKTYTDGSKITNINVINVTPRGQWTSDNIEAACEDYLGAMGFLCSESLNDPDYRYRPKSDNEML